MLSANPGPSASHSSAEGPQRPPDPSPRATWSPPHPQWDGRHLFNCSSFCWIRGPGGLCQTARKSGACNMGMSSPYQDLKTQRPHGSGGPRLLLPVEWVDPLLTLQSQPRAPRWSWLIGGLRSPTDRVPTQGRRPQVQGTNLTSVDSWRPPHH